MIDFTSLVSNFLDCRTIWPVGAGIKCVRNVGVRSLEDVLDLGQEEMSRWMNSHQSPEEVVAGGGVKVPACSPGALGIVDGVDEGVRQDVVVMRLLTIHRGHKPQQQEGKHF